MAWISEYLREDGGKEGDLGGGFAAFFLTVKKSPLAQREEGARGRRGQSRHASVKETHFTKIQA